MFKNEPSKIFGLQPLKILNHFKLSKGCLPKILLGPFLNTLSHMMVGLVLKKSPLFATKNNVPKIPSKSEEGEEK